MSTGGVIMPYSTAHMESACQINEDKVIHPFAFRTHTHSLGKSRFITFITCIRRLVARLMHHNIIDNPFSCTKIFSFTVSKIFDGFFFDIMFFVIYIFRFSSLNRGCFCILLRTSRLRVQSPQKWKREAGVAFDRQTGPTVTSNVLSGHESHGNQEGRHSGKLYFFFFTYTQKNESRVSLLSA